MKSYRLIFLTLVYLGLQAFDSASAQSFTATVRGTVQDESGAVVAGANVSARNVGKGVTRDAVTNDSGEYVITQLQPETYELTIQATNFKTEVRADLVLQVGQEARIDITLTPGSVAEQVVVTAAAPLVQSENAQVGSVIDERKIKDLPLNGREFFQLAQLAPNVFNPPQGSTLSARGGFNVAGNPEVNNNFILDGIDNNDDTSGQPTHRPSVDGIQEFRVLTGTYAAEYGRQSGGQIIITTKSGTNNFNGTLFEFLRNDNLDARNFFNAGELPELKRNQYGGSLGGRILRDRTFFFATYEGLRLGEGVARLTTVPNAQFRNGDFSRLTTTIRDPLTGRPFPNNIIPADRISPVSRALLQYYPLPSGAGLINNYNFASVRTQNLNQFSGRVDHTLSDNNSFFVSYQFLDRTNVEPSNPLCGSRLVPGFGCTEPERTQHISIVDTHIFSPALVNEFRVGFNRLRTNRFQEDEDLGSVAAAIGIPQGGANGVAGPEFQNTGVPQITITGFATIGGATNLPQGRRDNTYNVVDNVTYTRGDHTIKFGGDFKYFIHNVFFTTTGRGAFAFNGQFTGNPFADFLLGGLRTTSRAPGAPFQNTYQSQSGFYAQDDWKVSDRLTLNYGLRYELNYPQQERVDKTSNFDPATGFVRLGSGELISVNPTTGAFINVGRAEAGSRLYRTDRNDFAPRVGFAFRPFGDDTTVVRGGYGIFYNQITAGNGLFSLYGLGLPFVAQQTFTNTANVIVATWDNPFPAGVAGGGSTPGGINPDFPTPYIQQWSLGAQRSITPNLLLDITYLGSKGTHLPLSYNINQPMPGTGAIQPRRPYRQWGNVTYRDAVGTSNYNSLAVRVERRFAQGLSLLSSYTFSKSIDLGSPPATSGVGEAGVLDPRDFRLNRGLSEFDVRHRFVTSFIYELPFGRGRRFFGDAGGVVDKLVGGWELTGIATLQSGRPFTVTTSSDVSNTGAANRPFLTGDPYLANPTPERWFNTSAFSNVSPTGSPAYGNVGRNTLTSDGINNFDLALFKNFAVGETRRVQLRAEAFNVFNHANFGVPDRDANSPTFGRVSSTTTLNRQIQLGAKFIF